MPETHSEPNNLSRRWRNSTANILPSTLPMVLNLVLLVVGAGLVLMPLGVVLVTSFSLPNAVQVRLPGRGKITLKLGLRVIFCWRLPTPP